jgi:glycosyltransferase involved in cell wall biosynthesis
MIPNVSVVIATHNHGKFLAQAIESALTQSLTEIEVLVIDDGSTDETPEVVRRFLGDRRVLYERSEHLGPAAAKNVGVRMAQAPFIAFLDADDVWLPGKLERQLHVFNADPELGVVYARRLLIDESGTELEYVQPPLHRGQVLNTLFRTAFICCSSAVVRAGVFDDVGLFDEGLPLAIDYELWLRVALHYRFDYVDEPLVLYRTGHASLSQRHLERMNTVQFIISRFVAEHGAEAELDLAAVRYALAETCCHRALALRQSSRLQALAWYVRALAESPTYAPAWRGLASLPLPEKVRRGLRRALGRSADWSQRRPVAR